MKFKFEAKGLKELNRKLEKAANKVSGKISFDVLFNPNFMAHYTDFSSIEEFFAAGGFIVNSKEDFEAIPDDKFEIHIKKTTKFSSWDEMKRQAGILYVKENFKI